MSHALCDYVASIPHPSLRHLTEKALAAAPVAFWSAPASTSGKYHPAECRTPGGLVQHTRAVFIIARALLAAYGYTERDTVYSVVLSAALLHDTYKVAEPGKHTCFEHPMLVSAAVSDLLTQHRHLPKEVGKELLHCLESHMGRWNTSTRSTMELPLPATTSAMILHHADLIASRPQVHVDTPPEP